MIRQVGLLAAAGLAIGIVGAFLATPVVESLLIGVSANDPAGFAMVSLMLMAVAIVATWVPAWRASAVDPTVALRDQ
jgi:ABC-type lipoprotein release transport system permease subunit